MGLLYTPMKVFHYPDKLASLNGDSGSILPPLHIRIKPTNVCNHRCRYCAYRADQLQLGQDMNLRDSIPRDRMLEIIDDIIDMGVKAVTFSGGGEPFCYPHLLETVERLAQSPVKFAALTNGSRMRGALAELFAHHATWVRISIDGWDGPSYSRYRGVAEDEFAKVTRNIEAFKRLGGGCYLGVSLIVDRDNWSHIYDFVKQMKELGVDSVKISPCIVSNDGQESRRYHQDIFERVRAEVERVLADLSADDFEIFDSYHALEDKFDKTYTWCPALQMKPVIGADLNVYSCQDKAYNLETGLIGSLRDRSFKDFWFSDRDKFFKIDPSRHCNHHCVVNRVNELILGYLGADEAHLAFV